MFADFYGLGRYYLASFLIHSPNMARTLPLNHGVHGIQHHCLVLILLHSLLHIILIVVLFYQSLLLFGSEFEVFGWFYFHVACFELVEEVSEKPFELLAPHPLDFLHVLRLLLPLLFVIVDLLPYLRQIIIIALGVSGVRCVDLAACSLELLLFNIAPAIYEHLVWHFRFLLGAS